MQISRLANFTSQSPHKLFQALWTAVEANESADVQALVDALIDVLQDNQRLAASSITELIRVAWRSRRHPEIIKALIRLPGFEPRCITLSTQ